MSGRVQVGSSTKSALCRPLACEMTSCALAEYECKARGAGRMAYPSVVAGGKDSCTIHYLRNNKAGCATSCFPAVYPCYISGAHKCMMQKTRSVDS